MNCYLLMSSLMIINAALALNHSNPKNV
jgi:hypothetical protein